MSRAKAGFTLIELLVVIAIIAILAGMLMAGLKLAFNKAKESEECSFLRQVSLAALMYKQDCGVWFDTDNQSGGYRIRPDSILKPCRIDAAKWKDPTRKKKVEEYSDFASGGVGMKNVDHPPDGYGRVFFDFEDKIPGTIKYVINNNNTDPIAEFNAFWPALKLPTTSGQRTQFLLVSAGSDGEIDMDPNKDIMFIKTENNENPVRWRGQ